MSPTPNVIHRAGDGWTATVQAESMIVRVSPEDDPLPDALDVLLSRTRQPFYVIEHLGEDDAGWDVYEVYNAAMIPTPDDFAAALDWVTIR